MVIATPEGVQLDLVLAGLGSRMMAGGLDLAIKLGLILALVIALLIVGALGIAILIPASALILLGYDVLFETRNAGRTPGKLATSLRVVSQDGTQVDLTSSLIRNAMRLFDGLPTGYIPTVVGVLVTDRNQRPGDLAGRTLVVRDRAPAPRPRPAQPPHAHVYPPAAAPPLPTWDLSAISAEELALIRSFLARRAQLTPAARASLARRLSDAAAAKIAGAPAVRDDEAFLEQVAAARAARG